MAELDFQFLAPDSFRDQMENDRIGNIFSQLAAKAVGAELDTRSYHVPDYVRVTPQLDKDPHKFHFYTSSSFIKDGIAEQTRALDIVISDQDRTITLLGEPGVAMTIECQNVGWLMEVFANLVLVKAVYRVSLEALDL